MSLRLKLLLLGLATLVLPWGGCSYAREMEAALRARRAQLTAAVAQTIAASLQGRTDLLYRARLQTRPAGTVAPRPLRPTVPPSARCSGPYDLRPLALSGAAAYRRLCRGLAARCGGRGRTSLRTTQHRFGILTGVYERMLYVLLEVRDEHLVFDAPGANVLDPAAFGDRIWIGFEDPRGRASSSCFSRPPARARSPRAASRAASTASASAVDRAADARRLAADAERLPASRLRVPLSMLGGALRGAGGRPRPARRRAGELRDAAPRRPAHPGRLIVGLARADHLSGAVPAAGAEARGAHADRPHAGAGDALAQSADLGAEAAAAGAAVSPLRRPGRRAAADRVTGADLRPRPRTRSSARLEVDADRRTLGRSARPGADPHAELHARSTSVIAVDRHVRLRRLAGAAAVAAAPGERVGAHAQRDRHRLPGDRARAMSWAMSRAASRCCSGGSTSTPAICAPSPASYRTRSARRSPSCAPRSTTWRPRRARARRARPTSSAPARGASA